MSIVTYKFHWMLLRQELMLRLSWNRWTPGYQRLKKSPSAGRTFLRRSTDGLPPVRKRRGWRSTTELDEKRYSAGKGTHLTLKRAEKARATVNKIPVMVEALQSKTAAWEKERKYVFTYDGHPLMVMLEQYMAERQEKEQEYRRQRDLKRLNSQLIAEQEVLFWGARPSTPKLQGDKKAPRTSPTTSASRRISLGAVKPDALNSPRSRSSPQKGEDRLAPQLGSDRSPTPPSSKLGSGNKTQMAMMVANSPSTPTSVSEAGTRGLQEEIEYSVEERRAGFCLLSINQKDADT